MPVTIPEALSDHTAAAQSKSRQLEDLPRYLCSAALAGAFVGLGIALLFSVGGPLVAAGSPLAKLLMGAVFGLALTLVVFAGGELATGNMMVMTQAAAGRAVQWQRAAVVCVAALIGNFIGSIGLALILHGAGTFSTGPSADLIATTVAGKDALAGPQLFWRAVLCNALVCLGLWMAARTKSDAAKLALLWWALLAFIASGFEHSVANMTTFSIAALNGTGEWSMLGRNLVWTIPGNLVGGAVLIGGAYAWLGRTGPSTAAAGTPSSGSAMAEGESAVAGPGARPAPVPVGAASVGA